jgi:ferritin-like protein
MDMSQLSQARSNTVSKILNAPDFAGLLIEHGWAAFPDRFLKAVANAKDTATQVLLDVLPALSLDVKILVAQQSKQPFIAPCMIWPELVWRWQPWQYASEALAWEALSSGYPALIESLASRPMASRADHDRAADKVYSDYFLDPIGPIVDKLANNPGWPTFWGNIAIHHPDEAVRENMVFRLVNPPRTLLQSLLADPSHLVRCQLVSRYHEDEALMMGLLDDANIWVTGQLAERAVSSPLLTHLSQSMELSILGRLAHNRQLYLNPEPNAAAVAVWQKLAQHPYVLTADSFAAMVLLAEDNVIDWPTFASWAEQLADKYPTLRAKTPPFRNFGLSEGPLPQTYLHEVASKLFNFNRSIAHSPLTPVEILSLFSQCPFEQLREEVAQNPALPDALIEILLNDPSPEVARITLEHQSAYVRQHPELFSERINDADADERRVMAENEHCSPALLERLGNDEDERVRAAVASNPQTTAAMLMALAQDSCAEVLSSLAGNPNTPEDIREKLIKSEHWIVLYSLVNFYTYRPTELLNELAQHSSLELREILPGQPYATASLLTIMAQDKSVKVRRQVARHPNTPDEVLAEMLVDKDEKVVKFATQLLKKRK